MEGVAIHEGRGWVLTEPPRSRLTAPRILFVSTYPPTRCGIANYTHSLVQAMAERRGSTDDLGVVRLLTPGESPRPDPIVEAYAGISNTRWVDHVAQVARAYDVVWLQHEFGIYGEAGDRALSRLTEKVSKPIITTLHTVLRRPDPIQRDSTRLLVKRSAHTVVISRAARQMLVDHYRVDPTAVEVVPHGVRHLPKESRPPAQRPVIVTWGLLGPGKGIEWGIRALRHLKQLDPPPRYVVAGATHPQVLRTQGDTYRLGLCRLARELGVEDLLRMEDTYLSDEDLERLLESAHVVVLPYDSTDQVSSGVLVEALGAGLPVVATAFPHAIEMLEGGAGIVVPHRDPKAMADAISCLLTDPDALSAARTNAARIGRSLQWPVVAEQCETLAASASRTALARGKPREQAPGGTLAPWSPSGPPLMIL